MSQSEQFGEAWAHVRDHARPVIQDDVYFLDAARADMPPSKSHLKRLARNRPEIVPAKAISPDVTRRRQVNEAAAHGARIAALLGKTPYKASPLPRSEPLYIPPEQKGAGKVSLNTDLRARRAHMIAMSKMVYREYNPSTDEIVAVFGSVETWNKAKSQGGLNV